MKIFRSICFVLLFAMTVVFAEAQQPQQPQTPEEKEKALAEYIEKEVVNLEGILKLESWQVFYVDSIMTHDYHAMQEDLDKLQSSKVSNYDIYMQSKDSWAEKIYTSLKGVFTEEQWAKYLKTGAAREKKARDKRKAKLEASASK